MTARTSYRAGEVMWGGEFPTEPRGIKEFPDHLAVSTDVPIEPRRQEPPPPPASALHLRQRGVIL